MALFDRTAKHLARGPSVLFPADPADAMAEAIFRYDPDATVKSDKIVFHNGVHLYGPVELTADVVRKAGLPVGMAAGYYAAIVETGSRGSRPDDVKSQDAEKLIRGLAARLGGTVHDQRPPMDLQLRASVFSGQALPAEQVISVLQPFIDSGNLYADPDPDTEGAYYLVTEEEPLFFAVYWPPRLARSRLALPPPALGGRYGPEPSRWDLRTKFPVTAATRETCLRVGEAALALAARTSGTAVDTYGFRMDRPADLAAGAA